MNSKAKFSIRGCCLALLAVALPAVALLGCGYTFQGSGSILPEDVTTVQIPLAVNETTEPGLSQVFTEALRDHFERFGVVRVVNEGEPADAILRTKIVKLKRSVDTVTSTTDRALQVSTTMTVAAELRRVTGPLLYRNPRLSVSESFGTDSDVVVTTSADFSSAFLDDSDLAALDSREIGRGQEQVALVDIAEKAARKIYDEAVTPDF